MSGTAAIPTAVSPHALPSPGHATHAERLAREALEVSRPGDIARPVSVL